MAKRLPTVANDINLLNYTRLVAKIAMRCGAKYPVEDSEQFADGWLGLLRACQCYDPACGVRFSEMNIHGDLDYDGFIFGNVAVDDGLLTDENVIDREEQANARAIVNDLLRFLDERSRQIVALRWLEGHTLHEVGDIVGLTKERVRQLIEKAMRKMQAAAGRLNIEWSIPMMELRER